MKRYNEYVMEKLVRRIGFEIELESLETNAHWDYEATVQHYTRIACEFEEKLIEKYKLNILQNDCDIEEDFDKCEELQKKLEKLENKIGNEVYDYVVTSLKEAYEDGIKILAESMENGIDD